MLLKSKQLDLIPDIVADSDITCKKSTFDVDYEGPNYAQEILRYTLEGATIYIQTQVDYVNFLVGQVVFPDMEFSLGSIQFQFKNLQLTDVYLPSPALQLYPDTQFAYISVVNAQAQVSFEFDFTQKMYPYIRESGTGSIQITNATAQSYVTLKPSDECKGRFELVLQDFYVTIQNMIVSLNSENAWLYEGLINAITNVVTEIFNEQLSPYFQDFLVEAADKGLYGEYGTYPYQVFQDYATDIRNLDVSIYSQYFDVKFVGTLCFMNVVNNEATCTGHTMDPEKNYYLNVNKPSNSNIQLIFGNQTILSMLQYFCQNETITAFIEECFLPPKIVNTGVVMQYLDTNQTEQQLILRTNFYQGSQNCLNLELQLDENSTNPYKEQINTVLHQLYTGTSLILGITPDDCYPIFQSDSYISFNCDFNIE